MTASPFISGEILDDGLLREEPGHPLDQQARTLTAQKFRESMRRLAAGTCVVTTFHKGEIFGLTATSVASLSMEPPSLFVSIRAASRVMPAIRKEMRFTVHVLAETQQDTANAFAGRLGAGAGARLIELDPEISQYSKIPGALSHIDCKVVRLLPVFTHVLVIGAVEKVVQGNSRRPLIYFDGDFHGAAPLSDGAPAQGERGTG